MKNRQVRKFLAISLAAAMATGSMSTTAFAASGYLDPNASIERGKGECRNFPVCSNTGHGPDGK
ncbi:MAG: hypothetical protein ACLTTO_03905 [Lachnospiraceae bacterium]